MPTVVQETSSANALAQIRARLPALSDSETQVAHWVLHNAEKVMHASMAQIAQACDVSDTTVLRLCRKAGFRGFTDLKISLAQDLARPTQLIHDDIVENDDPLTIARKVFMGNIQALYDTLELLDQAALIRAVHFLEAARQILIVGVGASSSIAHSTYHKFFRLGLPCIVPSDAHTQLMQAALLRPQDLAIVISHSGETRDPILILKEAKRHDACSLCLTSNPQAPLTKYADVILQSVSHETRNDAIAARVAQTTIIDALHIIYSLKHLDRSIQTEQRIIEAILQKTY